MFFQPRHIVFPVNTPVCVALAPVGPVAVAEADTYELKIEAYSGLRRYSAKKSGKPFDESRFAFFETAHDMAKTSSGLQLDVFFPQEDRWLCTLLRNGEKLEQYEVCSLEDDLFRLTPYKGDNHMHTCFSDGRESPEYRAANCCRRAYDYCVITDHHCYSSSVRAKEYVDSLQIPYMVIPGEEIHAPGNLVHIINMGGNAGVTEWYKEDPQGYEEAVNARMATIDEPMSESDKWMVASSMEVFDRIHERGGVAIVCHPHWVLQGKLQHHDDVTNYLFDHKTFDVFELIAGGAFEEGTQLQLAFYHDQPAMPVVGSSDTHQLVGGRLEPGNYTIAFAEELSPEAICKAVRKGTCVAGIENKFWGEYRLVKYAYFLSANVFPQHDKNQAALGDQLLFHVSSGMPEGGPRIEKMQAIPGMTEYFDSLRWKAE